MLVGSTALIYYQQIQHMKKILGGGHRSLGAGLLYHARVLEGVAKSQASLKAQVFKSQRPLIQMVAKLAFPSNSLAWYRMVDSRFSDVCFAVTEPPNRCVYHFKVPYLDTAFQGEGPATKPHHRSNTRFCCCQPAPLHAASSSENELSEPLSSEHGIHKTVEARFWP